MLHAAHAIQRNEPRRPASHAALASIDSSQSVGEEAAAGSSSTRTGCGGAAKLDVGTTPPAMSVGEPHPSVSAESGCSCGARGGCACGWACGWACGCASH